MEKARRNFLKIGCTAVAGTAMAGGLNLINVNVAKANSAQHPYGWPIYGLDVEATMDLGYQGYKGISRFTADAGKDCASGTFGAIVGQLQEVVGGPYSEIPLAMMQWASGGVVGFGTLCGALNGAAAAIGLVCGKSDAKAFIADLLTWYSETNLPAYIPAGGTAIIQTKAESNLCHVSVTRWCNESGFASGSSERSDRCARLTADVAAKTVEMLNSSVGGELGNPRDNNTKCGYCHYKGQDYDAGQFTRGKMNCMSCHDGKHNKKRYARHEDKHDDEHDDD